MSNIIKFTKDWLIKLSSKSPPKRTEYKDSDNKYLRAIHHPSGMVKLSLYKCPRGQKSAVRVALPFTICDAMPNMQRIRSEANKLIVQLDQGQNPNDAKKVSSSVLTLQQGLDNYLAGSTNTDRVNKAWSDGVEVHLKEWLNKPLAAICTPKRIFSMHRLIMTNIARRNQSLGMEGTGGIGANNVMKKLRRILNFNRALDKAYNLPYWPTEELGPRGLKMWIEQRPRTRRIYKEEFPLFWTSLENLQCTLQHDLLKFILLTGCRSGEARGLKVENVNLHRWSITFKKTKNGLDHTLPLTETLKELVLRRLSAAEEGKLFPFTDPKAITKHIERSSGLHITPHDLRRTFASVAEIAGVGSTTKKDLLNHLSGRDITDDYTGKTEFEDLRQALENIERKMLYLAKVRS